MNRGDIITHVGQVTEAYTDMSISVLVPAIAESPIDQVRPEFASPLKWVPREGDDVLLFQRLGSLRPDMALTWVGWAYDDGSTHIVPPWMEAGVTALTGVDNRVGVFIDDDEHPTGSTSDPAGALRLGRYDGDEPVVLGDLYKAGQEEFLNQLSLLIRYTEAWISSASTVMDTLLGMHGAPPEMVAHFTVWREQCYQGIITPGGSVREQLVGTTVPPGQDLNSLLPDHLSNYVFSSKVPDPDPPVGEDE